MGPVVGRREREEEYSTIEAVEGTGIATVLRTCAQHKCARMQIENYKLLPAGAPMQERTTPGTRPRKLLTVDEMLTVFCELLRLRAVDGVCVTWS